ncbi:MAG: Type II secretory pathway, pullulanase PulA and related glycosidase [Clostridiales bacterium]|nr:Type II secretory pathway, pullulanase PulA and related glycosidase [Clostridiales bacterium]
MGGRKKEEAAKGCPFMLGAVKMEGGYNFAVEAPEDAEVSLLLYRKNGKKPVREIPFSQEARAGRVHAMYFPDFSPEGWEYNYRINGTVCPDPAAPVILGRNRFGAAPDEDEHRIRSGFFPEVPFDWGEEKAPDLDFADMILYKLHVRGYTMLLKNGGKNRGTFAGLAERIPYWKDLGVNALELMPVYEFPEVPSKGESSGQVTQVVNTDRVNYWGYIPGYYFAPKRSYSAKAQPEAEFCALVKALHEAGMECILEFYFPEKVSSLLALRVLQFWRLTFHVDGFHVLGSGSLLDLLSRDGILSDCKMIFQGYDGARFAANRGEKKRRTAVCSPDFYRDMRRFLKSDEGMVESAAYHVRHNGDSSGVINYMVYQDGFTMNDLVSYNYKHNEANGEENRDGNNFNYSWNCGVEGPSRKKLVTRMRRRQVKNAFLMMLLSQGVPMLYGGDEFLNSQEGNNNAWCQDNPTGWIDWRGLKRNREVYDFVKDTIAFRRAHPILHMTGELQGADFKAAGFPDISFHGERAWYLNSENTCRLFGVMYCGAYAKKEDKTPDDMIYVGYNFHWENRSLALPNLPAGHCWKKIADTGEDGGFYLEKEETFKRSVQAGPRTILVLIGVQEEKKDASVATLQDDHETQMDGDEILLPDRAV